MEYCFLSFLQTIKECKIPYALDLQIFQALKISCYKNLHKYMEISNKKESSANVSGDGPSSKYEANKLRLERLKILIC